MFSRIFPAAGRGAVAVLAIFALLFTTARPARGEAMLELFQMTWPQITQKMPELAEAGYDSLWVPNPCKGNSGTYDVGYAPFDPFDLGSTNQVGTVATKYGTEAQLLQMVLTAHRFGIRVYFDNVMNHRASTVPGYPGSGISTNYYPGLIPQDFHLQTVSGGYQNWPNVNDWCSIQNVENFPLIGLCDLAQEPGTLNYNFGAASGDTTTKPVFIRFPGRTDLYMDTNGPLLGAGSGAGWPSPANGYGPVNGWRPFDGNGQPVPEDVSTYLCRAVAWTLYTTKCDGFRLDAVKHVPSNFFGNESGQTDDPNFGGYTGAIQAMYDYVHGYGSNVTGNGYVETDGNRNSLFNTESARNDAMIFGEYIPEALSTGTIPYGEDFYDYLNSGMRLLNQPLYNYMNGIFNYGTSMAGLDSPYFTPPCGGCNCDGNGNYAMNQAVNMPQTQDGGTSSPANEGMEDAYFFLHEGLPMVYSDGFNHNPLGGYPNYATPISSSANYLGEFGDNSMPDVMYLHNQLSRGGTWPRWSDQNIAAFERYDYREGVSTNPWTQDVVLFAMNDNTGNPGDEYFFDNFGDSGSLPASFAVPAGANGTMQGMVVNFPIGAVLHQLATSTPGYSRTFQTVTVRTATNTKSVAEGDPSTYVYVGNQTLTASGGAIEFMIPSDGWVMYGYQWPQPSQANPSTNAVIFQQGGVAVPHITVYRTDGTNGDSAYNPLFPFKMRGSVDAFGNVITGANYSNLTYAIDVPVVTNAPFDIITRSDASSVNTLVKLDGGIDLNSQMGLGPTNLNGRSSDGLTPTNFLDLRDNKPGYADDVFLGYEQTAFQFRNGPEKFAARNVASNNIVSLGAETYYYTVGGADTVVSGAGYGANITNQGASWVYHDPLAPTTVLTNSVLTNVPPTQMVPTNPTPSQAVTLYVKVGYELQINTCFIYYTTDGSNPEGAFGLGKGTTQVVQAFWVNHDSQQSNIDWWSGTIPAQASGTQVRYKVALFYGGSVYSGQSIQPISDGEVSGSKLFGLTQNAITNFNPTTAIVWLHNDLNPANTVTGLQSGFHIVRARTFLPRTGQASVYNTFLQTFYYDGALPTGVIAYPASGSTITQPTYTVVVRTDGNVTGVDCNIQESLNSTSNYDIYTGQTNGLGNDLSGNPIFKAATAVTPNTGISATYPNYPQEFRFVYTNVPNSGTATIYVRLKDYATGAYTNRYTMLTASVNTLAPTSVVEISSPGADGTVLPAGITSTNVYACFTSSLYKSSSDFEIIVNTNVQPLSSYSLRPAGANTNCNPAMRTLIFTWNNPALGSNVIQIIYTNAVTPISDSRLVIVAPPLQITGLTAGNSPVLQWSSLQGLNYQVLTTTNLTQPFQPAGAPTLGQGSTTTYFDTDTNQNPQKFYEIEMVP
jgi:hypothetical protein